MSMIRVGGLLGHLTTEITRSVTWFAERMARVS